MPEQTERFVQRIPAGAIAPADQVERAFGLVRSTTAVLDLAAAPALLEGVLADMTIPCTTLAAAGVLVGVGLTLREGEAVCGVCVLLDQESVGEAEEVDFSALRLLVGPEAEATLEIICADCALSRKLVDRLLPGLAAETLAVAQIRWQAEAPEADLPAGDEDEDEEKEEEDWDEYDDEREDAGESF